MMNNSFRVGILYEKSKRLNEICHKIGKQVAVEGKFRGDESLGDILVLVSQINALIMEMAKEYGGNNEVDKT